MIGTMHNPCGFCVVGQRHDLCPIGVENGNGDILRCPCGCKSTNSVRCLDCGYVEYATTPEEYQSVDPRRWRCIDPAACASRSAQRTIPQAVVPPKPARRSETPRKARGECLCCGEQTGGGKFRPGHDSRYLAGLQADIRAGDKSLEMVILGMQASGLSTALQDKLRKRVNA